MKGMGGKRSARFILKFFSVMLVLGLCAFGVARTQGIVTAADCGPEGLSTVSPKMLRGSSRGAWTTEAVEETNGKFVVTKPEQLAWVAEQANAGANDFAGKTISIEADLDLSASEWVPIGISENFPFRGSFRGNGHTISNMTITRAGTQVSDHVGLIGAIYLTNASGASVAISDVHLRNVKIKIAAKYIGGLVGRSATTIAPSVSISNVTVQGTIENTIENSSVGNNAATGGIAGAVMDDGSSNVATQRIENCHVLAGSSVKGMFFAGGIVGMTAKTRIENCSYYGETLSSGGGFVPSGATYYAGPKLGGIAGQATRETIDGCIVSTDMSMPGGKGGRAGGIVGFSVNYDLTISNCAVFGSIRGLGSMIGGIFGGIVTNGTNLKLTISNCTNAAAIVNHLDEATVIDEMLFELKTSDTKMKRSGTGGIVGLIGPHENPQASGTFDLQSVYNRGNVALRGTPQGGTVPKGFVAGVGGILGATIDASGNEIPVSIAIRNSANTGAVEAAGSVNAAIGMTSNAPYAVAAGGLAGALETNRANNTATFGAMRSYSAADVLVAQSSGGFFEASVGGLVGRYAPDASSQSSELTLSDNYAMGGVTAPNPGGSGYGYAGGLVGKYISGNTLVRNFSYAESMTGSQRGGLIGQGPAAMPSGSTTNVYYGDAALMDAGNGAVATYRKTRAEMESAAAYAGWAASGYWNVPASGLPSPKYDAVVPTAVVAHPQTLRIDGTSGLRTIAPVVLPDEKIRSGAGVAYSWTTVPEEDRQKYFAHFEADPSTGVLSFVANGTGGHATLQLSATGSGFGVLSRKVEVFISPFDPDTAGHVSTFYVRNVPLTPVGDGAARDLYIQWENPSGAVFDADALPDPMPELTWSVVSPADTKWNVTVTPDPANPLKARLSVVSADGWTQGDREQYQVAVHLKQTYYDTTVIDETYSRAFLVGRPFLTEVYLSPEAQEEIDRVNAILARTDVAIVPGNHQMPIPQHILDLIAQHLETGLVTYEAGRAASGDVELFVLASLDQIESLTVVSPDESSVPDCFECTDKQSANIVLDLEGLTEADGKVVLLPMSYTVKIQSNDLRDFYDEGRAREIVADPAANLDTIFDVLVLHKRIHEGDMTGWYTRLVRGVATPQQAYDTGMLQVWSDPAEQSLTVSLGYYVADYYGESFTVQDFETAGDETSDALGYIVLPDGLYNRYMIDPLWTNRWTTSGSGGGGGGGGGCAAGATVLPALFALCCVRRRKKIK